MSTPSKTPTAKFDLYDAVMEHDFKSDVFASHFAAAGIESATFNLERACVLHTRLMADPLLAERRASEIAARQAKFSAEPFAGRFEESLRLADGVTEFVLHAMTPQERGDLRRRVTR